MDIHIETPFQIEFDKEYFMIYKQQKHAYLQCTCCDGEGYVTIKKIRYTCPRCNGSKTSTKHNRTYDEYYVANLSLLEIGLKLINDKPRKFIKFKHTMPKTRYGTGTIELYIRENKLVEWTELEELKKPDSICETKIYNDYNKALAEAERLNAEEQNKIM